MFLNGSVIEYKNGVNYLYNEEILFDYSLELNHHSYYACIIKSNNYYQLHILDDFYKKEQLNTLKFEFEELTEIKDDLRLWLKCRILEHWLWHTTYGYKNKFYSFDVAIVDSCEL